MSYSLVNQNTSPIHINHINLDTSNQNLATLITNQNGVNGPIPVSKYNNMRNKSATNIDQHHYNSIYRKLASTSSSSNNITSNNTNLGNQPFKIQNSLTKNFIDFSNLNHTEKMFQLTNTTSSTPVLQSQRVSSGRKSSQNMTPNNQQTNSSNGKLLNESNKFLDEILAHSKRNNKQTTSTNNSIQLPSNVTIINRTVEERQTFPDKLILERKNLAICPIIEGDNELKLINYQHNHIKSIQNLDQMKNLIFLDLYDNCIERITGISSLANLRVLMLGKNRIQKVENLTPLVYLDILDLHGNQVSFNSIFL